MGNSPSIKTQTRRVAICRPSNRYYLSEEAIIGKGELSTVYKCEHPNTKECLAIKRTPTQNLSRRAINRLNSEANMLVHICSLPQGLKRFIQIREGYVDAQGAICLVTEYLSGQELHNFIKQYPGGVPEHLAKRYTKQILESVQILHSSDIAHLDLKLENMIIQPNDEIKLIDFGFACKTSQYDWRTKTKQQLLLRHFRGSLHYVSPEIVKRRSYDGKKADTWSMGVLVYTMLCARFPFNGRSKNALFSTITTGKVEFPSHVSPEAQAFIMAALTVDPHERPNVYQLLNHPWIEN